MFRLGVAPKETFLAYSTHFVFLTIRLVPGNVVMVAINMYGKSLTTEEWIYGISWKHVYLNISFLFTVDTTFILKLAFLLLFVSVLMQGHLGGCVVAIIVNVVVVVVVYLFIYLDFLSIYLFIYLFIFFCRFDRYSYLCCRCFHRYCYFCCWCHRCLLCVRGCCCS